jgi:hypothetical protein
VIGASSSSCFYTGSGLVSSETTGKGARNRAESQSGLGTGSAAGRGSESVDLGDGNWMTPWGRPGHGRLVDFRRPRPTMRRPWHSDQRPRVDRHNRKTSKLIRPCAS